MTDTNMLHLASYFRPLAQQLLDRAKENGVECRVVDTARSFPEQVAEIAGGRSWTQHSKHLPQPPEMLSEAIDIVPLCVLAENRSDWDPQHPAWLKIGVLGEGLGLRWGGRWQPPERDPSHFEYVHPAKIEGQGQLNSTV